MKPLSASYLARRLLNREVPWTLPNPDMPGFARFDVAARMEDILPHRLPATLGSGEAAALFPPLAKALKTLKTTEQIDRNSLMRAASALPPIIVQARELEQAARERADPDHPLMQMMQHQHEGLYFQTKDPLFQYHTARARRIALETLHEGLADINEAMARTPPKSAQGR